MKALPIACLYAVALFLSASPLNARAQAAATPPEAEAKAPAVEKQAPEVKAPSADKAAAQPSIIRVTEAPADGTEAVVSMSFDETPLSDVIKAFRDATGANIISSGTNLQDTVSVRLDNVPWKKGLSSILDQRGLQLVEQPPNSGIFMVTPKLAIEVPKITQTFSLAHCRAQEVATLFKSTIGPGGTVTPFPSANAVIVTATEQQVAECEKIIAAVDKPRAQVYIEARFVELTSSASKQLGLNWKSLGGDGWGINFDGATLGYQNDSGSTKTRTHGTGSSATQTGTTTDNASAIDDTTHLTSRILSETVLSSSDTHQNDSTKTHTKARAFTGAISADAFELAINAFEQMDGVSVFSNPRVIVANEETARVDMTTKEPNVELQFQAATSQNGSDTITTKLGLIPGKEEPFVGEAFFSYGISLKVTPRVSNSGLITVEIEPSISELIKYFELQGITSDQPSAKYPVIEMRRIKTIFTMNDGKTAVIGGLTRTTEESIDSGIPWLRELPWIGPRLFGWKSRNKEQREIIVFVTVGIADPVDMKEDAGLPKNALFGRDFLTGGKRKEPGDRTLEEVLRLEEPRQSRLNAAAKPAAGTEADAAKPAQ